MKTAALTIISHHHRALARTLLQSLRQHEPGWDRYVLIIDQTAGSALIPPEEAETFHPEKLPLPNHELFFFQYSMLEAATAVKPWAIDYLLGQGYEAVVYFDADIKVYSPLEELRCALESHEILLTPHTLAPYPDDALPNESTIRLAGIFNLGFAAFRRAEKADAALRWWKAKTLHNCRVAPAEGVFVDQCWMDFAPHYFGAQTLAEPGYNVSYWNLHERTLEPGKSPASELPLVNGKPLRFMHFSGFDPATPRELSKHQTRFRSEQLPKELIALLADYAHSLEQNGHRSAPTLSPKESVAGLRLPYALRATLFTPDFLEKFLRETPTRKELPAFVVRYFCQPDLEFRHLPLFLGRFYALRSDLQHNMENRLRMGDVGEFLIWFESNGRREWNFDPLFPTHGWWTESLTVPTKFLLSFHRLLFNAGLR